MRNLAKARSPEGALVLEIIFSAIDDIRAWRNLPTNPQRPRDLTKRYLRAHDNALLWLAGAPVNSGAWTFQTCTEYLHATLGIEMSLCKLVPEEFFDERLFWQDAA